MRAELPWNVAGIPPEAREAARAAARREGLSVGEWLTRRILRSFSDLGEGAPPSTSFERAFERAGQPMDRAGLDPWGMPPSTASRRDTEEMLSRVSRSEAESSDAFRRIEDHLRSVTRRLDSAERSQSENNRAMNQTASEINVVNREQAQAFDQLATHVVAVGDRLERLERAASQDGLKDAVKALHNGLSRLADQMAQTATQSAQQVSAISGNMEQLAGRLGQVRTDVEATTRRLEARISQIEEENRHRDEESRQRHEEGRQRAEEGRQREEENRNRFAAFEAETQRNLDQRFAALEKAAQFNTNALDHALERLEAQAGVRAGDQAELQKRHAETDGAISRIEENIERLDAKTSDPAVDRRLDSIERALGSLVSRLETYDPAAPLEDTLRALTRRLDSVEKSHGELMDELRANLAGGGAKAAIAATEPPYDPALFETKNFETRSFGPNSFDADSFAASESEFEAPPFAEPATAFTAESHSFGADLPPSVENDPFAADSFATGAFTPSGEETLDPASENFLAAARRSAKAAAEADAGRGNRLGFTWGSSAAAAKTEAAKPERSKLTLLLILGIALVLALFAGVTLSQRLKSHQAAPAAPKPAAEQNNAPFTPAPQVMPSPNTQGVRLPFPNAAKPAQPKPVVQQPVLPPLPGDKTPATAQPQTTNQAPGAAPQLFQPAPKTGGAVPTLDRVTQLANSGNAIAETVLGLKELDGDGVPADPADGAKWLERAAEQGQAVAQYRLGAVYERGQGVAANAAIATHWYQLAANQGNRKAMHNLAVAYASGAAGKKDMAEAARWFAKAADLGLADSQFNLAVLYERGDGVPQSLLDAYKWYAIASGQGDTESKSRLAVLSPQLSDDDRAAAQKSATTFRAAPLNRAANIPPEMADLAGN